MKFTVDNRSILPKEVQIDTKKNEKNEKEEQKICAMDFQ